MQLSVKKSILWHLLMAGALALLFPTSGHAQAIREVPYVWYQGDQPLRMSTSTNSVCFLTGMSGKFQGSAEFVRVTQHDGYWYLEGGSRQSGVSANARCIEGPSEVSIEISTVYPWSQANHSQTQMIQISGSACFLSRISGKFQGSGEIVQIVSHDGYWWLTGKSGQTGVNAEAICIKSRSLNVSEEYTWYQNHSATWMENSVCFLTMVSGKFMGSGESVTIDYVPDYERFILWGFSFQKQVRAGARCINFQDVK